MLKLFYKQHKYEQTGSVLTLEGYDTESDICLDHIINCNVTRLVTFLGKLRNNNLIVGIG